MKNETTMTKLTPAQAYALQAKADRRAAAVERQGNIVREDNARVKAIFANTEVAKIKQPAVRKYVPWGAAETEAIVKTYIRLSAGGVVNRSEVIDAHRAVYPRRSEGAINYVVAHLQGLDVLSDIKSSLVVADHLVATAYEVDPERFPSGTSQENKIVNAIDVLLAELRGVG
jgi:hypothetical protein